MYSIKRLKGTWKIDSIIAILYASSFPLALAANRMFDPEYADSLDSGFLASTRWSKSPRTLGTKVDLN